MQSESEDLQQLPVPLSLARRQNTLPIFKQL